MKDKENSKKFNKGNIKRRRGKKPYNNTDKTDDNIRLEKDDSDILQNRSRFGNPNWYFTDKALAEQTAQYSFQDFIGSGHLVDQSVTLPSIMTLSINPSADSALAGYDKISTATLMARKLYNNLANSSGRVQNYAPQDVYTLLLALGEVISYISFLKRALGVAFTYNVRNRDFPMKIIESMGINASNLFKNLNSYRVQLNTIITEANKIPFPANIAWFDKCSAIYEGIFQDNMSPMSQIYILIPATTWQLDETSYEEGTVLRTTPVTASSVSNYGVTVRTMDWHLENLRNMIQALLTSATLNYIYGDILNHATKFGTKLLYLNMIEDSYSVMPQYDQEVLLHIHNMILMGIPSVDISSNRVPSTPIYATYTPYNDVFPDADTNSIVYNPVFNVGTTDVQNLNDMKVGQMDIVDFPFGVPDIISKIEATRFQIRNDVGLGTGGSSLAYIDETNIAGLAARVLPDHYPVLCTMYSPDNSTGFSVSFRTASTDKLMHFLTKFDNAPLIYITNTETGMTYLLGDVNYYANLDNGILHRTNTLTYQSLLELR